MPWTLEALPDQALLRVTTSGSMTLADVRQMAMEAVAAGKQHGIRRYLVDHRLMQPAMSAEDIFDLHAINAGLGVNSSLRVAIVYSADSPGRDDFFFYEVHTLSRGASNIRLFTDLLQALDWLSD